MIKGKLSGKIFLTMLFVTVASIAVWVSAQAAPNDYDYYPQVEVYSQDNTLISDAEIERGEKLYIKAHIYNNGTSDNTAETPVQYTYYMFKLPSSSTAPDFTQSSSSQSYYAWSVKNIPQAGGQYGVHAEYSVRGTRGCEWIANAFGVSGIISESDVYFDKTATTGQITNCGIVNHPAASNGNATLNTMSQPGRKAEVATGIEFDTSTVNIGEYICGFLAIRSYNYAHRPDNPPANHESLFENGSYAGIPQMYRNDMDHYYPLDSRPQRRLSVPKCLRVVEPSKDPKVQFWGADVRSEDKVITSNTITNSSMYGSWAEYAVMAEKEALASSGAGLSTGAGGKPVTARDVYNKLTFANKPLFGQYGAIAPSGLPLIATRKDDSATKLHGTRSASELAGDSDTTILTAESLTISAGEIPRGKTVVIQASDTVTISGNITYAHGSYIYTEKLPQLLISAKNIVIEHGVTEVSAWLISRDPQGYMSTCGAVGGGAWLHELNRSSCSQQLKINGPVIAHHVYLRRTFGAEPANPGIPAEILNLRPDAYLWAYDHTQGAGNIKTMYIRELPPRY